jgi:hypothetical protein
MLLARFIVASPIGKRFFCIRYISCGGQIMETERLFAERLFYSIIDTGVRVKNNLEHLFASFCRVMYNGSKEAGGG